MMLAGVQGHEVHCSDDENDVLGSFEAATPSQRAQDAAKTFAERVAKKRTQQQAEMRKAEKDKMDSKKPRLEPQIKARPGHKPGPEGPAAIPAGSASSSGAPQPITVYGGQQRVQQPEAVHNREAKMMDKQTNYDRKVQERLSKGDQVKAKAMPAPSERYG